MSLINKVVNYYGMGIARQIYICIKVYTFIAQQQQINKKMCADF